MFLNLQFVSYSLSPFKTGELAACSSHIYLHVLNCSTACSTLGRGKGVLCRGLQQRECGGRSRELPSLLGWIASQGRGV